MKGYCYFFILFALVFLSSIQVSESVTVDSIRYKPYPIYTTDTTCSYVYEVAFQDPKGGIQYVSTPFVSTFSTLAISGTLLKAQIVFKPTLATSGDLVVSLKNSEGTTFSVKVDAYQCLAVPEFEYDKTSAPVITGYGLFYYDLKITTPMTQYLNMDQLKHTSSPYSSYVKIMGLQQYRIYYALLGAPPTTSHISFSIIVNLKTTPNTDIFITIPSPFTPSAWVGTSQYSTSPINPDYSFTTLSYENNLNGNLIASNVTGGYYSISRPTEGNTKKGIYLIHMNRKGLAASTVSIKEDFNTITANAPLNLGKTDKTLPAQTSIAPQSYALSFIDALNRPATTFFNAIYNSKAKVFDSTQSYLIKRGQVEAKKYLTYPYSYSLGNIVDGYKVSFSYPTWNFAGTSLLVYLQLNGQTQQWITKSNPTIADITITSSCNFIAQVGRKRIYRLNYSSASPFDSVVSPPQFGAVVIATPANIVSGNEYNGAIEFNIENPTFDIVRVVNDAGNVIQQVLPNPIPSIFTTANIKGISFSTNNIDTTLLTKSVPIRATLKLDVPDLVFRFLLYSTDFFPTNTYSTEGYDVFYNPTTQEYIVDFEIHPRRPVYYVFSNTQLASITSLTIDTMFPQDTLKVTYENVDEMPPMVTSVSIVEGNTLAVDSSASYTTATFAVTIKDTYNGLKNGTVWIAGEYDPVGFNFTFTPADAVSGDMYLGTYHFPIKINNRCVSQKYFIQDMKLFDNSMIISSIFGSYPNPIFDSSKNTPVTFTCSDTRETVAPVLTSFNIITPSPVDITAAQREVVVEFAVTETGSGIEPSRTPTVYATEAGFRSVSAKSELIGAGLYRATVKLPYGFGTASSIYFSVYGLIDNHLNFNGYSTADLQTMGFGYFIETLKTFTPLINGGEHKIDDEGTTTISGFNLGNIAAGDVVKVEYTLGSLTGFISAVPTVSSNTLISFVRPTTFSQFKVRVTKNGLVSNVFVITPIKPSVEVPAIDPNVQKILMILQLIEQPLLIQSNKLVMVVKLITELQIKTDITQLEIILNNLKARPTPELQAILQLRAILLQELALATI